MAKPKLLATFLHLSDLHIGSIDPGTGDADISPAVQVGLDNFPVFDGLLGHRARALRDLAEFVEQLRASDENFNIVITGDLSRDGDAGDLALARRFFEHEIDLNPPDGNFVGLYAAGKFLSIPGNHDHWAGVPLPIGATPSSYYHQFAPSMPAMHGFMLGRHGHTLTLVEVDSDADVKPNSIQRTFARGNFHSQLQKLDAMLDPHPEREVRVLVIHHARTWQGFDLAMTGAAKRELDQFIQRQGISVILCGHTHQATLRRHYAGKRECWECGAGSTTQFDTVPFKWRRKLRDPDRVKPRPNSLLLHRIFDIDGRLEWNATRYVRSATGFNAMPPPRQFALL